MVTYTSLRHGMSFYFATKTPRPQTGRRTVADVEKLTDLGKNDNQGEQHQGFDERESQNQGHLNRRASSRVSGHGFAGRGANPALPKTGQAGRDGNTKTSGNRHQVIRSSGGCALRVRRHGHHQDGQQRKENNCQFPHSLSPYESLPVGG